MQREKIKNAVTSALQGARDGHRWGNTVASAAKSADQFMTNRNMQGIQARVAGRAAPMGDNVVRGYTGYRAASRVAAHQRANNPPPPGPRTAAHYALRYNRPSLAPPNSGAPEQHRLLDGMRRQQRFVQDMRDTARYGRFHDANAPTNFSV